MIQWRNFPHALHQIQRRKWILYAERTVPLMYSIGWPQRAEKSVDPPNLKQSMCEAKAWWMGLDNQWSMEFTQWKSILLYPYLSLCPPRVCCDTQPLIPWQRTGVAPALVLDCCEEEKEEGAEVCRLKSSWIGWLTPGAAYSITVAHNDAWWDIVSNGMEAAKTCAAPDRSALQEGAESSHRSRFKWGKILELSSCRQWRLTQWEEVTKKRGESVYSTSLNSKTFKMFIQPICWPRKTFQVENCAVHLHKCCLITGPYISTYIFWLTMIYFFTSKSKYYQQLEWKQEVRDFCDNPSSDASLLSPCCDICCSLSASEIQHT